MRRTLLAPLLLLLLPAAGCATAPAAADRPADIARPEIVFAQQGSILFGSGTEAPVKIDMQVTNRANVPLIVREVDISSAGMAMIRYALQRTVRAFNETIAPGETRIVTIHAMAETADPNTPLGNEPLAVRAIVLFDAEGRRFKEIVQQRIVGYNR